jgi:hypothetical protein
MQRRQKGQSRNVSNFEIIAPNGAVIKTIAPIPESALQFFIRQTCGDTPVYYTPVRK